MVGGQWYAPDGVTSWVAASSSTVRSTAIAMAQMKVACCGRRGISRSLGAIVPVADTAIGPASTPTTAGTVRRSAACSLPGIRAWSRTPMNGSVARSGWLARRAKRLARIGP
ncbi:MAG: hypothetical protein BGO26_06250 [Actinobacteria bacterium 69-20]|nr:MAG: hypothetical protein BGO26_06250 [Actinobacteria bacterium 69-20]